MFGSNVKDITDIAAMKKALEDIQKKRKLNFKDYKYLSQLITKLKVIRDEFDNNWRNYTWESRMEYNKKWNITLKKIEKYQKRFAVGNEILYYIGDRQVARNKWRTKWTGPWIIDKKLNDSTLIISDPTNGNQKRVSFDRIKLFKRRDYENYAKIVNKDGKYMSYEESIFDILSNYDADVWDKDLELDYTKNRS